MANGASRDSRRDASDGTGVDIDALFRRVREHPDFVFGTIFVRDDFPRGEVPEEPSSKWANDTLAERGNLYIRASAASAMTRPSNRASRRSGGAQPRPGQGEWSPRSDHRLPAVPATDAPGRDHDRVAGLRAAGRGVLEWTTMGWSFGFGDDADRAGTAGEDLRDVPGSSRSVLVCGCRASAYCDCGRNLPFAGLQAPQSSAAIGDLAKAGVRREGPGRWYRPGGSGATHCPVSVVGWSLGQAASRTAQGFKVALSFSSNRRFRCDGS
jgi:hypothetical protein